MEGNLIAIGVIIGVVRGINVSLQEFTKVNVTSTLGFVLSLATGIILGILGYFGLTIETGIISALAATGTYQIAKKIGGE